MYMSFIQSEPQSFDTRLTFVAGITPAADPAPRAAHARLLAVAAARRLRAIDRLRGERREDAEYWLACAPVALVKAAQLRSDFAPLP